MTNTIYKISTTFVVILMFSFSLRSVASSHYLTIENKCPIKVLRIRMQHPKGQLMLNSTDKKEGKIKMYKDLSLEMHISDTHLMIAYSYEFLTKNKWGGHCSFSTEPGSKNCVAYPLNVYQHKEVYATIQCHKSGKEHKRQKWDKGIGYQTSQKYKICLKIDGKCIANTYVYLGKRHKIKK